MGEGRSSGSKYTKKEEFWIVEKTIFGAKIIEFCWK
jgi:beta-N-acetylglucosaminidase